MPEVEVQTTLAPEGLPEERSSKVLTIAGAWQRIKEHKVIQWGIAYFAAALALAHAYEIAAHTYHWPPVVGQVLVGMLAIGFLVALVLAWYHGHKGLTSFSKAEMSILAALMIVGAGMLYLFVEPAEHGTATQAATHQELGAKHVAARPDGVSLAVLPFLNLSDEKQQEFFSDGMTEEITSALAKVSGLNVIGRTSAFQFKGTNKDLRAIGQALGANHLIEGSVRKAGNKVRITAQLIKADDGTHLWSESYERELKDVFAVQEEIATAIAGALQVPLGLAGGQSLVANRTADTESYQDYLRAKTLVRERGPVEPGGPLSKAAALLERAVAREPNYAPAWGLLAQARALTPVTSLAIFNGSPEGMRSLTAESLQKAETAAQRALRLDPSNIDAIIALAQVRRYRGNWTEAEDLFKQALSVDPGDPVAIHQYSTTLAQLGRMKEALPLRRRLQAQEPFVPVYNRITASILWATGANNEALALVSAGMQQPNSHILAARIYASQLQFGEAARSLEAIPSGVFPPVMVKEAARLLRSAPTQTVSPQAGLARGQLGFVYLYAGAPDRALDFYLIAAEAKALNGLGMMNPLWGPSYAQLRKTERFEALVRKMGLVDYWRARGWPEFCRPTTGDDFVCH